MVQRRFLHLVRSTDVRAMSNTDGVRRVHAANQSRTRTRRRPACRTVSVRILLLRNRRSFHLSFKGARPARPTVAFPVSMLLGNCSKRVRVAAEKLPTSSLASAARSPFPLVTFTIPAITSGLRSIRRARSAGFTAMPAKTYAIRRWSTRKVGRRS